MPSPFPGMDPFLEDPAIFPDLHDSLVTYVRDALQAALPERYYSALGTRVWIEMTERWIGPDVHVKEGTNGTPLGTSSKEGGVAVSELVASEPVLVAVPREEHREPFVEIYAQDEQGHRLVSVIEVLSLTNKTPGADGRTLYQRKQKELIDSRVNLVEIDLLRGGTHVTGVPLPFALRKTGPFHYHVCVFRAEQPFDFFLYPRLLPLRLPVIEVPLLAADPAIKVDLQALLDRCYGMGRYHRRVRYRDPVPPPALASEFADWVDKLLTETGFRGGK